MFAHEGEGYSRAELRRNIMKGNILHLWDLVQEKANIEWLG
jgi:hypothetical protein